MAHVTHIREEKNKIGGTDYVVMCDQCGRVDKSFYKTTAEGVAARHERGQ